MRFPLLIALLLLLPGLCAAQDDSSGSDGSDNVIHAITAIHPDGSRTVTVTNPEEHSSEATTYDAANKMIERIVYTLDENNVLVTGLVYGPGNTPSFKSVYKHDDLNRISEEDDYTLDDLRIWGGRQAAARPCV